jgi:glycerol 2-dehydrogenase (NADP+)
MSVLCVTVARGSSVIPKSVTPSRIEENMRLIKLDSGDMKALDNIAKTHPPNRFVYPAFGVSFVFARVSAVADSVLQGQSRIPR